LSSTAVSIGSVEFWRTEERELGQRSVKRILELADGNLEEFGAAFGRETH
jgi:hypothetical protein